MPRRDKQFNYDVNRDYQLTTLPRDTTRRILYTYPDLSARTIEEVRASVIEEYHKPDRFGRRRSLRELALLFRVSLRTIVYAVNPGIERDVARHTQEYNDFYKPGCQRQRAQLPKDI